jgi:5-methylcytosine-specific restriction protein A
MVWGTSSRQSRGYGAAWEKLRLTILTRDCGLCQPCKKTGKLTTATEVDHIISKAKAKQMGWPAARIDGQGNLQSICTPCHKTKTQEERGFVLKPEIGPDGWPVG